MTSEPGDRLAAWLEDLDLAPHLAAARKKYYLAEEVGHYGIFNGSKWRKRIAPVVEDWIRTNGA